MICSIFKTCLGSNYFLNILYIYMRQERLLQYILFYVGFRSRPSSILVRNEVDTFVVNLKEILTVTFDLKVFCFKRKPIRMCHLRVVFFKWPGIQRNLICYSQQDERDKRNKYHCSEFKQQQNVTYRNNQRYKYKQEKLSNTKK